MKSTKTFYLCHLCFALLVPQSICHAIDTPVCLDPSIEIELVASEPSIVTPISCRFDGRGRLFVVESHTHFPPEDYEGPKTDQIKIFDDPDGDGKLDRVRVFHHGTVKTMGMVIAKDGSVIVSTRSAIIRLRDTDNDDVADESVTLVSLDTKADYPHNGLSGLLAEEPSDGPGVLTFGMGENFGESYVLTGTDGSLQTGGGEGGNIFRCRIDGSMLERVATGFWNPFGICRDEAGRLLMVDNDADAMPPCRIVNVKPRGDYGFQFRFGRAGTHPLQAWNGELPGTLPMVAGTGEAPCAIISNRGQYWVTGWGDNRMERYTPSHHGDSITADRDIAIQGNAMFRPVDMAIAPDGSMYITDWVDRSYNVHRKGRIWRVSFNAPANPQTVVEKSVAERESDLAYDRPPTDPIGVLMDQRWRTLVEPPSGELTEMRSESIRRSLDSGDEQMRLAGIRWATETGDKAFLPLVKAQLDRELVSARMVAAIAASSSYLETGKVEKGGFDALTRQLLVDLSLDDSKPMSIRAIAMRLVPPDSKQWPIEKIAAVVTNESGSLQREAARHLAVAAMANPAARSIANTLLKSESLPSAVKLDLATIETKTNGLTGGTASRPDKNDLDAWMSLVGEGGDREEGWRVFFDVNLGKCSSCHARDGRGAGVGPDLTSLSGMDRRRLLDSILHPSREIGPMYTTWKVLTDDGRTIAGLKLNGGGVGQSARYLLADSSTVDVPLESIEFQEASTLSIMPEGLESTMTVEQLRNLLAYLSSAEP